MARRPRLRLIARAREKSTSWTAAIGRTASASIRRRGRCLKALEIGFETLAPTGAARKRHDLHRVSPDPGTLEAFLESHGYAGQVVSFNGTNGGPDATAIYERWAKANRDSGRASGSRAVDVRTALIEHFRDEVTIMIATEAGAEGVNLQFCSLVVNYDLPWNPQRIEQRIGRCHRYGQKHDVVVINFLNERNAADQRVLELLAEKFKLFDGVSGRPTRFLARLSQASISRIASGHLPTVPYSERSTPLRKLQAEMDEQIRTPRRHSPYPLEHFDEDVHQRLRLQLADTKAHLDRVSKRFWGRVTQFILDGKARFEEGTHVHPSTAAR